MNAVAISRSVRRGSQVTVNRSDTSERRRDFTKREAVGANKDSPDRPGVNAVAISRSVRRLPSFKSMPSGVSCERRRDFTKREAGWTA